MNGKMIEEFVGLASKKYSIKIFGSNTDLKKTKGIKRHIIRNQITYNDYKFCFESEIVKRFTQKLIRSEKHNVYTIEQYKRGLNPFDDKRYLTKGFTDTLPSGHYKLDVPKENFIQHLISTKFEIYFARLHGILV